MRSNIKIKRSNLQMTYYHFFAFFIFIARMSLCMHACVCVYKIWYLQRLKHLVNIYLPMNFMLDWTIKFGAHAQKFRNCAIQICDIKREVGGITLYLLKVTVAKCKYGNFSNIK